MSDLTKPILMTEDPLEDVKRFLLLNVISKNKRLFKLLIIILILFGIMLTAVNLYYQKLNLHHTLVTILLLLPGFSSLIIEVSKDLSFYNSRILHYGWSTNQFSNITANRIKKVSKWFYCCTISNCILVVILSMFTFPVSFEGENVYILNFFLIKKFFGKYYIVPLVAVAIYFCLLGYSFFWLCTLVTYIAFESSFQYILMAAHVNNLKKYKTNDNSIQDDKYQLAVQKTLIDCIEHQITIKEFVSPVTENGYSIFLTLGFLSVGFLFTIICGYCLLGEESYYKHDIRIKLRLLSVTIYLIAFCATGQYKADTCLEFYNSLRDTDWYYWNKRNKDALIIMLRYNLEPLKGMQVANVIKLEYPFILTWFRAIYQAAAIFVNMKTKN